MDSFVDGPDVGQFRSLVGLPVRRSAGEKVLRAVLVPGGNMTARPNERELVGHGRLHRKMFADVDPRHVGPDRPELAAILGRRVGLQIVRLELTRTSAQPDENAGRIGHR